MDIDKYEALRAKASVMYTNNAEKRCQAVSLIEQEHKIDSVCDIDEKILSKTTAIAIPGYTDTIKNAREVREDIRKLRRSLVPDLEDAD